MLRTATQVFLMFAISTCSVSFCGDPPARIDFIGGSIGEGATESQSAWARHLGIKSGSENSVGAKMVLIPPGRFMMGGRVFPDSSLPEGKVVVSITRPFLMGETEVTQAEWSDIMGRNPSYFSDGKEGSEIVRNLDTRLFPVEDITWFDVLIFCNALSDREKLPRYYEITSVKERPNGTTEFADVAILGGVGYRLPTEAEWEYACRAGTRTAFSFGRTTNGDECNILGNSPYGKRAKGPSIGRPCPVKSYAPNRFGLWDMHGNVAEWTWDTWKDDENSPAGGTDPRVDGDRVTELHRIIRGGSWIAGGAFARSTYRDIYKAGLRNNYIGFRLVRSLTNEPDAFNFGQESRTKEEAIVAQDRWARFVKSKTIVVTTSGTQLALIPPGTFPMGYDPDCQVTISKPFLLGTTEVTRREWNATIGSDPLGRSFPNMENLDHPATGVSWFDAADFCNRLSSKEKLPNFYGIEKVQRDPSGSIVVAEVQTLGGNGYRLPSEAEWEYSSRAGSHMTATLPLNSSTPGQVRSGELMFQ